MKRYFLLAALCVASTWLAQAQTDYVWHNPLSEVQGSADNVWNRGWKENNFCRLPARAEKDVREAVWWLANNSAGLAIRFRTDAQNFTVRYGLSGYLNMPHMPSTGVSGLDCYRINPDGSQDICWGNYRFSRDTTTFKYIVDIPKEGVTTAEYVVYLPLYNTVTWLEVGLPKGKTFSFVPAKNTPKPVVVYGTSIAQGGCCSRPAMAWTNIVDRAIPNPVINLGFSGNGRLEPEVLNYINEIDAAVYVMDCIPNVDDYGPARIKELVCNAVRQIRSKHPQTPILLIDRTPMNAHDTYSKHRRLNTDPVVANRAAYDALRKEGQKNLYFLSTKEMAMPLDGCVDYAHLTDYGMLAHATATLKKLKKLIK